MKGIGALLAVGSAVFGYGLARTGENVCSSSSQSGGNPQDSVVARSFVLTAADGRVLAKLGTTESEAPGLWMYGRDGEEKARLFLNGDSGEITIVGPDSGAITMCSYPVPELSMTDKTGQVRGRLRLEDGRSPELSLMDSVGNVRATLCVENRGKEDEYCTRLLLAGGVQGEGGQQSVQQALEIEVDAEGRIEIHGETPKKEQIMLLNVRPDGHVVMRASGSVRDCLKDLLRE